MYPKQGDPCDISQRASCYIHLRRKNPQWPNETCCVPYHKFQDKRIVRIRHNMRIVLSLIFNFLLNHSIISLSLGLFSSEPMSGRRLLSKLQTSFNSAERLSGPWELVFLSQAAVHTHPDIMYSYFRNLFIPVLKKFFISLTMEMFNTQLLI